jgi:hypothetical protein
MGYVPQMKVARDPVENRFSLWSSVNLGATLCRKRTVSRRNTEAAQGTTEKKPRVELIGRISRSRLKNGCHNETVSLSPVEG